MRFLTPSGEALVSVYDGDSAAFGRSGDCEIRFGFAPEIDRTVPRIAGRLSVHHQRTWVESCTAPGGRVLQIVPDAGPPMPLAHGEGHAPACSRFCIVVAGETQRYTLSVTQSPLTSIVRSDAPTADRTIDHRVSLSEREREVICAYLAPVRRGMPEPASHREVSKALSWSPNYVRSVLYDVFETLFVAGIPMPEHSDKRVAVVEAARLHDLVDCGE